MKYISEIRFKLILSLIFLLTSGLSSAAAFSDETVVYYDGGNWGHIESCPRPEVKDAEKKTTYVEMAKQGGQLCPSCPGSEVKEQPKAVRVEEPISIDREKYGRKGARARTRWLDSPEKAYDPLTRAYCDALWMRVHEEDCPMLVLKDKKKFISLKQADREGWRIGESGQSGRSRCCFEGYRGRAYSRITPGFGQALPRSLR
jgi:hypothetical protein